jgi:hypothetical protein
LSGNLRLKSTFRSVDNAKSVHEFTVKDKSGADVPLSKFAGKPLLVVNVASKCGFTPQYAGLEALHKEFGDKVAIIGFPCNQFGSQVNAVRGGLRFSVVMCLCERRNLALTMRFKRSAQPTMVLPFLS